MLISSVTLTNFAYAQSTPKAQIVVNSITQNTPVIVANSPNNEFVTGVSNTGNAPGTKKITLVMYQNYGSDNESTHACTSGGAYEASVTLNPGEFVGMVWQCTVYGPGTYQVKSLGKTLDFQVSADQGKLYVSKVTVEPIKPKLGDNAVFTVTVKNFNTIQGSKNISYKLIFSSTPPFTASFGTKSITLGPEGSTTFTVDAVFSSNDPWRFYADDYVYDPLVEEAKRQLQKDIEKGKTEEEKQADEDRKQLQKDVEEQKKIEQEEETDDTDEIVEEEEQVTGSKLVVIDVIITPRKNLKPNDIVTITAVVKNVGDVEGTKSIVPVINAPVAGKSAMVEAQSVTVKPGKEKTLTWQIPILVSGIYDVFVDGKGDSFQVKSTASDTKKPTDTSGKKKFDIDDVADFDDGKTPDTSDKKFDIDDAADFDTDRGNKIIIKPISDEITDDVIKALKEYNEKYNKKQIGSSDKKKFDIDDAADFDTDRGNKIIIEPIPDAGPSDGVLSSEDLDRIKNISDIQVIDDMESIREKILSVDFGSVMGPSDTTESDKIAQKYDAANEKLRIAIEKREQIVSLKEQLEKEKEINEELEKRYNSDFNRWKKIWKENKDGKPSTDDKVREHEAVEDQYESQEKWEASGQEIHKIENKIRELESEADRQYNDAMNDLDSVADELDKTNQGEPNYEDKNQKPFVTDDLKKETYRDDVSRSVDDIMRVTEEYEKNRDALQKQNALKQIIRETSDQASSTDAYNKIMNSEFASTTFYPGDLDSLMSVTPRAEFQDAAWTALSDSGDLEKYKQKTLKKLEQKSESNTQQISTQSPLVDTLQDSSYFGTIPSTSDTENVATILFSGYSMGFGNNLISADIPIKSIFNDGSTAKYSVLGGNLVIVDSATNEIKDIHSVAFGKGRIDHQSGKMTFLINSVDSSGQHQTITLNSAELPSSIYSGYQLSDTPLTFST